MTSAMGKASSLGDIRNVALQVSAGRGLPWTVPRVLVVVSRGWPVRRLRDWGREGVSHASSSWSLTGASLSVLCPELGVSILPRTAR